MRDLAELTLQLCRIPSETGDERLIADWLEGWFVSHAPQLQVSRLGNVVVASTPTRGDRPTHALFGHTDTVRCAEDQPVEIRGDRVYGCGASDMKGGLAVMLRLLAEHRGEQSRLVGVFYDKEEGPIKESGLPPLFASGLLPEIDLAVCLEPTDNRIQAGCVGGLHAELTVRGRRAHSARPWQGENAIFKAMPLLQRLQAFGRREVTLGELTFYEVMTPTTTLTRNSRNVVPDAFVLNVNYRYAPGKPAGTAIAELEDLVAGEAEIEVVDVAPSGALSLDHPLVVAWRDRRGLVAEAKQAWTDVAQLTARGIPAINFGPGETAQAHQARESVPIAYLEEGLGHLRDLVGP